MMVTVRRQRYYMLSVCIVLPETLYSHFLACMHICMVVMCLLPCPVKIVNKELKKGIYIYLVTVTVDMFSVNERQYFRRTS